MWTSGPWGGIWTQVQSNTAGISHGLRSTACSLSAVPVRRERRVCEKAEVDSKHT